VEIGQTQSGQRQSVTEHAADVGQVQPTGRKGVGFKAAVAVGGQAPVSQDTEVGSSAGGRFGQVGGGRPPVVPNEGDGVDAGKRGQKPLLEPHQEVFDLGDFGLGLRPCDLAQCESLPASVEDEEDAEAAVSFL
jgi:hypothetical protein